MLGLLGKDKNLGLIIMSRKQKLAPNLESQENEMDEYTSPIKNEYGYQFAAQQILNAIRSNNQEDLARSLKSFISMCFDEKELRED